MVFRLPIGGMGSLKQVLGECNSDTNLQTWIAAQPIATNSPANRDDTYLARQPMQPNPHRLYQK